MFKTKAMTTAAGVAAGLWLGISIGRADAQDGQKPLTVGEFPNLGAGLLATPGCLGVKGFAANGGKQQVIMAWFENKKAVEAWYYSKMHAEAMGKFFPGVAGGRPLAGFKDEKSPVMVIASVTPSDRPLPGQRLAVSQIAIEAYTPVPGGAALGDTFAPKSLKVPGMRWLGGS